MKIAQNIQIKIVTSLVLLAILIVGPMATIAAASPHQTQYFAVDVLQPVCDNAGGVKPTVCNEDNTGGTNPLLGDGGVFSAATRILSLVAGISAVIVIIVAGMRIIFSNGDSNAMATSRKQIIYAAVGLGVIVGANAIIGLVLSRING